jgi:hypothetical protein
MSSLSNFMGSTAPLTTVLTSNDTILVGDLVAMASDGNAYACNDPTVGGLTSLAKPVYAATSTGVVSLTGLISLGSVAPQISSCVLTNGNVAILTLTGSGATLSVTIYSAAGVQQYPAISVAANSVLIPPTIIALSGGGFAVIYAATTTSYVTFAIYSNAGVQTTAPTIVDGTRTVSYGPVGIPLTGGGFAILYMPGSTAAFYAVYAANGGVTSAAVTVAGGVSSAGFSGAPLSNGGFILAFYQTALTIKTYNAAGVNQLSNAALPALTNDIGVIQLTGGGFAVWGTGGNFVVYILNSALVQQGVTITLSSATLLNYGQYQGIALVAGAFQLIWALMPNTTTFSNASVYVSTITAAGALTATLGLAYTGANGANTDVSAVATSDGGSVVAYSYGTTSALQKLTSAGAISNTTLTTASAVSTATSVTTNNVTLLSLGSGALARVTGTPSISNYTEVYGQITLARVPVGIALTAATVAQTLTVQFTGYATTRLTFLQPWSCDYRSNPVPGQRMSVVGNTAALAGVQ